MQKPLCFVLMPFNKKPNAAGDIIDFDEVYQQIIKPAIEKAGLEPIRADEEVAGGIIHKPMFERLILCEYAVADLTTANANVFYELGLRHAVRPASTVMIFSGSERLPFDVGPLRSLSYTLTPQGVPENAKKDSDALAAQLEKTREALTDSPNPIVDSPLFQLINDYPQPDIAHLKTDVFREQVSYSTEIKNRLAIARKKGLEAVKEIEKSLGKLRDVDSGAVIDLFLSYRAVKGWNEMVELVDKMPKPLAVTVMVREQLGLALNRAGRGEEAEKILLDLIKERGASSETQGILGRVYKDRWEKAVKDGDEFLAEALIKKAIEAYLQGFQSDWRDAYPGINAVTLMEIKEPPDPRRERILPIVLYAVEQRIAKGQPDYWDFATLLELAVLGGNEEEANNYTGEALAVVREVWEPETTIRNLRLIREARERRGENTDWIKKIEGALAKKAQTA